MSRHESNFVGLKSDIFHEKFENFRIRLDLIPEGSRTHWTRLEFHFDSVWALNITSTVRNLEMINLCFPWFLP